MSKSSKVPPPDPRLVEAQVKSMGVQDTATQEILRIAREQQAQMAELMPLQKDALQFALDSGRTAAAQAQADRDYFLGERSKFTALTDKMVADANAFDSAAAQASAAEKAQAGVGKAYSDTIEATGRNLASMGISPESGRALALREAGAADLARAGVGAANQARFGAREEGRALRERAAAALAGTPGAATATSGQAASLAAGGVNTANAGAGGIYSGYGGLTGQQQAAGGLAGQTGANAAGMYGAQAQYKLAADQQKNSWLGGLGSVLGAGARIATAFAPSDRRMKTGVVRIGTHPLGVGIYSFEFLPEFEHLGGSGRHVGVMADELAQVLPAAVVRGADGFDRVNYAMLGEEGG